MEGGWHSDRVMEFEPPEPGTGSYSENLPAVRPSWWVTLGPVVPGGQLPSSVQSVTRGGPSPATLSLH